MPQFSPDYYWKQYFVQMSDSVIIRVTNRHLINTIC